MRNVVQGGWGDNPRGPSNTGNGNPPGGDDVEARMINLENAMTDVRVSVGKVETRLQHIEQDMVTKGQMAIWALLGLATVGASIVGSLAWAAQQYLAPILAGLSKLQ